MGAGGPGAVGKRRTKAGVVPAYQDVGRFEVTVRQAAAVQFPEDSGNLGDLAAQDRRPAAAGELPQAGDKLVEVLSVVKFFGEQVAFAAQAVTAALQNGEGPGGRQTALAKALALDPGTQRGRSPK